MNLDFFNNLFTNDKEHSFSLRFIDELTEYLNSIKEDVIEKQINNELANFSDTHELISKYRLSYTFLSDFYQRCGEVLNEYSNSLDNDKNIYYVSWNNNIKNKYDVNSIYSIKEYSNGNNVAKFNLYGKCLPKYTKEGMLLKKNGNKYEIDIQATKDIFNKFQAIAEEIASIQEESIKKYRKENSLYVVVERCLNSAYLQDMDTNIVFEEVNFPKDVVDLLCNDSIVRFKNGKYVYEKELTDDLFNSFS